MSGVGAQAGAANPAFTHGHTVGKFSPEYQSWTCMIQRCTNPKRFYYHRYGGRGIEVCERWLHSFENFLADMGHRPGGTTLDRIDNDGHYEPSNCRWADGSTQARTVPRRLVEIDGERRSIVEWCSVLGISEGTVRGRMSRHKWDVVRALTTPPQLVRFTSENNPRKRAVVDCEFNGQGNRR